jgi:hypothetical protein
MIRPGIWFTPVKTGIAQRRRGLHTLAPRGKTGVHGSGSFPAARFGRLGVDAGMPE